MNRLIELSNLTHSDASALLDRVIDLDARIFVYPSEEARERYQPGMRDLALGEKLVVLYEEGGELVGYNLIKIQRLEVEGRVAWVVGSTAGFLPGHTGGNRTMIDAIRAMLLHNLGHPSREYFLVSFLVGPGGYDMLVDLCPDTFPSVQRPTGGGFEAALISAEAKRRQLDVVVDAPGRLVVAGGKVGREPFERRRDNENIRFFEALNPRHAQGELLGVCVPLSLDHLLRGALRLGARRLRKTLGLTKRAT